MEGLIAVNAPPLITTLDQFYSRALVNRPSRENSTTESRLNEKHSRHLSSKLLAMTLSSVSTISVSSLRAIHHRPPRPRSPGLPSSPPPLPSPRSPVGLALLCRSGEDLHSP